MVEWILSQAMLLWFMFGRNCHEKTSKSKVTHCNMEWEGKEKLIPNFHSSFILNHSVPNTKVSRMKLYQTIPKHLTFQFIQTHKSLHSSWHLSIPESFFSPFPLGKLISSQPFFASGNIIPLFSYLGIS